MSDQYSIEEILTLRKWAKYGELLPGVIHNLNTPIMGVSGRIELLQFRMPELKGLDQMSKQLEKINKMLSSIAYLLEHDKNIQKIRVDTKEIIEKLDIFFFSNMKYKHKLNVEKFLQDDIVIRIIPSYFQNIMFELIQHCIDKTEEGGSIFIKSAKNENYTLIDIMGGKFDQSIEETVFDDNLDEFIPEDILEINLAIKYAEKMKSNIKINKSNDNVFFRIEIPL